MGCLSNWNNLLTSQLPLWQPENQFHPIEAIDKYTVIIELTEV